MPTIKYAADLTSDNEIIDRHSGRVIKIDLLAPSPEEGKVWIEAHFDDNGDPWDRHLDLDSEVKVTE